MPSFHQAHSLPEGHPGRRPLLKLARIPSCSTDKSISSLLEIKCKTKEDFAAFSQQLYTLLIERHTSNPLFSSFVEQHVKDVCETLKDSEVRKAASGLSILANTKQQEQRDAKSGKKKVTKAKPILGGGKSTVQYDLLSPCHLPAHAAAFAAGPAMPSS